MPATARGGEDPGRVDVMISYARADEAQVFPWVQRLRQAGAAVWIDQGGIDGALLWGAEIVSAIERCTVFMLMISPRSIGSRNVWKEVHLADSAAKPILPLILEQTPIPTELAYALAGVQFLELQAHSEDDVMEAILRSLRRLGVGDEALDLRVLRRAAPRTVDGRVRSQPSCAIAGRSRFARGAYPRPTMRRARPRLPRRPRPGRHGSRAQARIARGRRELERGIAAARLGTAPLRRPRGRSVRCSRPTSPRNSPAGPGRPARRLVRPGDGRADRWQEPAR